MKHNKIDLHMHSNCSKDGQHSPSDLVKLCSDNGLKVIAISDHNSVLAIEDARESVIAQNLDLKVIPAVEIDCDFNGFNLHILGYGIDVHEPWFGVYEDYIIKAEREGSLIRARKVREMGIHLKQEDLDKTAIDGVLTGEMIAEVALEDPRNDDHPILALYRPGGSRSDNPVLNFYWDWCSQGKPASSETEFITAEEAVLRIKNAKGLAVLAHPGNNIKMDTIVLEGILNLGIDGIEVYSTYHNAEMIAYYRDKALKHQKLITLGSDYHGKTKPSIKLGEFHCPDEKELTQAFLDRPEIKPWL
jgi:predicted metal-dependent phosphoesterase TrpH